MKLRLRYEESVKKVKTLTQFGLSTLHLFKIQRSRAYADKESHRVYCPFL